MRFTRVANHICFLIVFLVPWTLVYAQDKPESLADIPSRKLFGISEQDSISDYDCKNVYVEALNIPVRSDYYFAPNSPAQEWMFDYLFQCNNIPKSHPYMESYYVTATEEIDIIHVAAISKVFASDNSKMYFEIYDYLDQIFSDFEEDVVRWVGVGSYSWRWDNMHVDLYIDDVDAKETSFTLSLYFPSYFDFYWELDNQIREAHYTEMEALEKAEEIEGTDLIQATVDLLDGYTSNPIAGDIQHKGKDRTLGGYVSEMKMVEEYFLQLLELNNGIDAIGYIEISPFDSAERLLADGLIGALGGIVGNPVSDKVNCWLDSNNINEAATLKLNHYVEIEGTVKGKIEWLLPKHNDINLYPCSIIAQSAK